MTIPLIKMVRKTYENKDGKWVLSSTETERVTDNCISVYIGCREHMKTQGAKVSIRNGVTPIGYKTNRITYITPSGSFKIVTTFDYSHC